MFLIALAVHVLDLIRGITCKLYSNASPFWYFVRPLLVFRFLQTLWTLIGPYHYLVDFSAYIMRDSTNYVQL